MFAGRSARIRGTQFSWFGRGRGGARLQEDCRGWRQGSFLNDHDHHLVQLPLSQEEMEEDGEESAPAEDLFSEIHLGQLKKVGFYLQIYQQLKKV